MAKEAEEKAKKEAEFEEEMRRRLAQQGHPKSQIDSMVTEEEQKRARQTTTTTEEWRTAEPVYAKIHRDYLSIDTLRYYDVPYEYDRVGHAMETLMKETLC